MPEYEIQLWSEDTFDVNSTQYTKEAYQAGKFAFVADYVRLWGLYHTGGIYMDTDIEVVKSLDEFLLYPAFIGFEDQTRIGTGIMGSEPGGEWIAEQLAHYAHRPFLLPGGKLDTTTNVAIISKGMSVQGFSLHNSHQNFRGIVEVFPKDYFCAKSYVTGKIELTPNTHTIHHFAGSWHTPFQKFKMHVKPLAHKLGLYGLLQKMTLKIGK